MSEQVIRYAGAREQAVDVAGRLLALLESLQGSDRVLQVALTGGGFAEALYRELGTQASSYDVNWALIDFWWGDERFVAADSPDRNAQVARDVFLDQVGATRVHEMPTPSSACSVEEGARAYEAQLRGTEADRFDVVLLSLGPDGHVASLFPGSPQLEAPGRIAVGVTGSPKPPPERITLTVEALNRCDRMWIFAADAGPGGSKEDAFRRVRKGDRALPAARVGGREETIWFVS